MSNAIWVSYAKTTTTASAEGGDEDKLCIWAEPARKKQLMLHLGSYLNKSEKTLLSKF